MPGTVRITAPPAWPASMLTRAIGMVLAVLTPVTISLFPPRVPLQDTATAVRRGTGRRAAG